MTKRINLSVLFAFLFILITPVIAGNNGKIKWEMAVLQWTDKGCQSPVLTKPVNMKKGESYQIYFKTYSSCQCYIIKEDSKGNLSMILNSFIKADASFKLPGNEEEYQLTDSAGTDRYYIVVSAKKQQNLEKLLIDLSSYCTDPLRISQVKDEILRIRQENSGTAESPEKPVAIGGVSRARSKAGITAAQYKGKNLYVKIIRIEY